MLVFVLMFVTSIHAFYHNNPTNVASLEIPTYWMLILVVSIALCIFASGIVSKEKEKYIKQGLTYPSNVCSRTGMRVTANILLIFSSCGFATMYAIDQSERITGLLSGLIFGMWVIIATLYAHCPKKYKKIRFRSGAPANSKLVFSIVGIILTFVLIITIGVAGGAAEDPNEGSEESNSVSISAEVEELY